MTETKGGGNFDWTNMNFNIHALFIGLALLLCGLSLALIAVRLGPVAKWANYQSICVDEISKTYPVEYSVRKCNGRSKIYMPNQQTQK